MDVSLHAALPPIARARGKNRLKSLKLLTKFNLDCDQYFPLNWPLTVRTPAATRVGHPQPPPAQYDSPAAQAEPDPARNAGVRLGRSGAAVGGRGIQEGRAAGAPRQHEHGTVLRPGRDPEARREQSPGKRDDPALRGGDRHGHLLRRVADENPHPLQYCSGHQGPGGAPVHAPLGRVPRTPYRNEAALRVRGHAVDVRGNGAYHHASSARRPRAPCAFHAEAPGPARPNTQERAGFLPQSDAGNPVPPQAAGRLSASRFQLFPSTTRQPARMSGQNSSSKARLVNPPTSPFEKNTSISP